MDDEDNRWREQYLECTALTTAEMLGRPRKGAQYVRVKVWIGRPCPGATIRAIWWLIRIFIWLTISRGWAAQVERRTPDVHD